VETFEAAAPPVVGTLGGSTARGVSVLVLRTLSFQLLTAGVTVVLARLLTPADYGLFAIALSVQLVGQNFAELGLPAALVRMPENPSPELQASTIGLLLVITSAAVAGVLAAAFLILPALGAPSKVLRVVAVTLLALPLYAARAVPMAMMDRGMRFGRVAAVEAADTVGFNLFALSAALAGLGVFSLAGAVPFGAMLGMAVAWTIQSSARRPRFELSQILPLIGFGSRVSMLGMLYLGRDLGFVTVIGALGGAPMAGFYAMAKRLFSFPTALAAAVSRVTLPALSQSSGQRPSRAARMPGQIALVCGLPLALVAGSVRPLIQVLLGPAWLPTTDIVLFGSLSMMLGASLASPINSYYLAEGKPNSPIVAILTELSIGLLLTAILIGSLNEAGIGIAMSAGALVSSAILLATAHPAMRTGATRVVRATAIAFLAAAVGHILPVPDDAVGLLVSLAVVGVFWLILSVVFVREELGQVIDRMRGLMPGSDGDG
jgi:lipopolysaccharide exporter